MTSRIGRTLSGFHHMVARRLVGIIPNQYIMGRWEYPSMYAEMAAVELEEVETYVIHHQNTIAQYIVTCPVQEIYMAAEHRTGA